MVLSLLTTPVQDRNAVQVNSGGLGLPRVSLILYTETKLLIGQAPLKNLMMGPADEGIVLVKPGVS